MKAIDTSPLTAALDAREWRIVTSYEDDVAAVLALLAWASAGPPGVTAAMSCCRRTCGRIRGSTNDRRLSSNTSRSPVEL